MTLAKPSSAALGAIATLLLLSACGGRAEADPEFLAQSPRAITKAAFAEMRDLDSVRILGRLAADEGGEIRVDMRTDGQGSCTGTVKYEKGAFQLLTTTDRAWIKPDEDFWLSTAQTPQQGRQLLARASTSWVVSPAPAKPLREFCDVGMMLDGFKARKDGGEGRLSKGAVALIGDTEAIEINQLGGEESATVWVSVTSPHRVVKIVTRKRGRGDTISFEEFGAEISAEAPATDEVIDLAAYTNKG